MDNSLLVLRVILQSSFAFVGLSILLGRMYFLNYFETLGIPTSEVSHNITDYSVIAPFVTLTGLLVVSVPTIIFLGFPPFQNEFRNSSRTIWGFISVLAGGLFIVLAALILREGGIIANVQLSLYLSFLALVFASLGGALVLSGEPRLTTSSSESAEGWTGALSLGIPILKTGAIIIAALSYVFVATILLVRIHAVDDAQRLLMSAPRAIVELADSEQSNSWDEGECSSEEKCVYRVILIGDHFVYLGSSSQESTSISDSSKVTTVYAVPIKDVSYFTYLKE